MKYFICTFLLLVVLVGICLGIFFSCTPTGIEIINNYKHDLQEADDDTNYDTLKQVEDSARAMIATYNKAKVEYENNIRLYTETSDSYYRQVADGYRQQANSTASTYNNYILKNKYIWKDNIPADIYMTLDYLQ